MRHGRVLAETTEMFPSSLSDDAPEREHVLPGWHPRGMEWLLALIGLLLGASGAYLILRPAHHREQEQARSRLDDAVAELTTTRQDLATAQGRLQEADRRRAEEAESARERESLIEMLHPVRQGVTEMHRKVQDLEKDRAAQHAQLNEQLSAAAHSDRRIIESTQALLGSLHSTTARGYWGEVQLRRVVEAAGMLAHVDFTEQHSSTSPSGEKLMPDMVVHLPGGRQLVIDAKAPLNPEDADGQARALRSRVDGLAKKSYWTAVDLSPDVVFCFVPAESLLAAALEADPGLLDHAISKGVSLISPASLLASLKAVETSWRQERVARNVKEIVDHSRELYQRLATMSTHLEKTGARLRQAVQAYNGLIGNVESRVLPKVELMSRLQISGTSDNDDEGVQGSAEELTVQRVSAEVNELGPRLAGSRGPSQ